MGVNEILSNYAQEALSIALAGNDLKVIGRGQDVNPGEVWADDIFTCVLGFTSDMIDGSFVFCCGQDFLEAIAPQLTDEADVERRELLYKDWVGEVVNRAVGRFKASLQAHDVSISLNPPSVSRSAVSPLDDYADRAPSENIWMELAGSVFCCQLGADVDPTMDFSLLTDSGDTLEPSGAVLDLNPIKRKAQLKVKSPPINPNQVYGAPKATSKIGVLGVDIEADLLIIRFEGGISCSVELLALKERHVLKIFDQHIMVAVKAGICHLMIGGLSFDFPQKQAVA